MTLQDAIKDAKARAASTGLVWHVLLFKMQKRVPGGVMTVEEHDTVAVSYFATHPNQAKDSLYNTYEDVPTDTDRAIKAIIDNKDMPRRQRRKLAQFIRKRNTHVK